MCPQAGVEIRVSDLYDYGGLLWQTQFESVDGFVQDTDGGSIDLSGLKLDVRSGNIATNYAILYKGPRYPFNTWTWDKKRRIKTRCLPTFAGNVDMWIVSGYCGVWGATERHIGFKIEGTTLYGTVADGTDGSTLDLGDPTPGVEVGLEAVLTPGVECRFYVNGVDRGAITTHLPAGTTDAEYTFVVQSKTLYAGEVIIKISEWHFLQEA